MSNTYYTSLSGMLAASYGLQNTSNNVANMQSPGYKRTDVFYSALGNGTGDEGLGSGVCVAGNTTNFSDGQYLETTNPADVAIVGQGFFVIRLKSGELRYTRDGEFGFNPAGILVDKHSGGEVQGYNKSGTLVPIHSQGPKTSAGKASKHLFLKGQFILIEKSEDDQKQPGPFKNKYENIKCSVAKIFDTQGKEHLIHLEFQSTPVLVNGDSTKIPDEGKSWDLINITCDDAVIDFASGQQILFASTNSAPSPDNSTIRLTLNQEQAISIELGTYRDGSDNSVELKESKQNPEGSGLEIWQNDGYGEGKQISFSFDEQGQIVYQYDNGQTINGVCLGLARFDDPEHQLLATHDSLFRARNEQGLHFGSANQDGFGSIQSMQIESSNVDSTIEFANIVVLQRMFQACSQIMDIDKQLLEELEHSS